MTPLYNDLKLFGTARKELCVALLAVVFLLVGLMFTPGNGQYIFTVGRQLQCKLDNFYLKHYLIYSTYLIGGKDSGGNVTSGST